MDLAVKLLLSLQVKAAHRNPQNEPTFPSFPLLFLYFYNTSLQKMKNMWLPWQLNESKKDNHVVSRLASSWHTITHNDTLKITNEQPDIFWIVWF